MKSGCPGHKGSTRSFGQLHKVKGMVDCSAGGCGGPHAEWCHGGILATCHTVYAVVHNNGSQVYVAACGMDEMVPTDSQRIAIAHRCDNRQIRTTHFHSRGKSEGPTVNRV